MGTWTLELPQPLQSEQGWLPLARCPKLGAPRDYLTNVYKERHSTGIYPERTNSGTTSNETVHNGAGTRAARTTGVGSGGDAALLPAVTTSGSAVTTTASGVTTFRSNGADRRLGADGGGGGGGGGAF